MDPITQPPILAAPKSGLMACVGYKADHPVAPERTEDDIVALAEAVGVLVITPGNADLVRQILAQQATR